MEPDRIDRLERLLVALYSAGDGLVPLLENLDPGSRALLSELAREIDTRNRVAALVARP